MLTSRGLAKVMDFGLAKLKGALKLTRTSGTVGTLGYMAPEQIQGGEADQRSDIFSFGVLLFEIFTGKLPFRGEHEAAMVYSITNEEPQDITAVVPDVSLIVASLVQRCLEKDPADRYQAMQDVVSELKRSLKKGSSKVSHPVAVVKEQVSAVTPNLPAVHLLKHSFVRIGGGVLLALFLGAGVLMMLKQEGDGPVKAETTIRKFTSLPGIEDEPTWSPDGKFLAYVTDDRGNFDIIVQPVDGGTPLRVANTDAEEIQPAWSPDGSKLAFVSARDHGGRFSSLLQYGNLSAYIAGAGGDIFIMPAFGGNAVKLVSLGFDPAWSPDGKHIVFRSARAGQWDLWTIQSSGGDPKQLTNDEDFEFHPSWSPDGTTIAYAATRTGAHPAIFVIPATGGEHRQLTSDSATVLRPGWSPDGKSILFSSTRSGSMNIWQIKFSPGSEEIMVPHRVTAGEGHDVNLSVSSNSKTISYATVKSSPDIWEFTVATGKLRQMSFETGIEDQPVPSPDDKTFLVQSDRGGGLGLWTMDINGTFLSRIAPDRFGGHAWSRDGKFISYRQDDALVIRAIGDISILKTIPGAAAFSGWSPDGKSIVFSRAGAPHLWTHLLSTGEERQITSLGENASSPDWSVHGDRIVFSVTIGNGRHVWIVPSTGGTAKPITFGEDEYSHPKWSPVDNDLILCLRNHRDMCLISASTGKVKELHRFTESGINFIDYPYWSHDAKKIFFSIYRKTGDVYVLENY